MQITVHCSNCEEPKRPLSTCPSCGAESLPETELRAWRSSLHAHHLARITDEPQMQPLPPQEERHAGPIRVVLTLDRGLALAEPANSAPIIPLEPPIPADDALSFDWGERPRRLRRSA
jgi:hypothetical protein